MRAGGHAADSEELAIPRHLGLTLDQYAGTKRLDPARLREWGVNDTTYSGQPALRIPYCNATGEEIAVRFRLRLEKGSDAADTEPSPPARGIQTTRYEIRDPSGDLTAVHVRRDFDDGTKAMHWERPDGRPTIVGPSLPGSGDAVEFWLAFAGWPRCRHCSRGKGLA